METLEQDDEGDNEVAIVKEKSDEVRNRKGNTEFGKFGYFDTV